MKKLLTSCLVATSLFAAASANAYFVRPFAQLGGGGSIDGFVENGATSGFAGFGNQVQTQVDLATGTSKNYLNITGTNQFAQSAGVFGDTISFSENANGTVADFAFDFDGSVSITDVNDQGAPLQVGITANFFIFEAGSGANYTNFAVAPGAVAGQSLSLDFSNPEVDLLELVAESLSGSLTIDSTKDYDIFASLSVFTSTGSNPVTVELDFFNTGTFGITVADDVTYASQSGVLLDSVVVVPNPAPVPGTLALFGLGLLGLASRRRSNRAA